MPALLSHQISSMVFLLPATSNISLLPLTYSLFFASIHPGHLCLKAHQCKLCLTDALIPDADILATAKEKLYFLISATSSFNDRLSSQSQASQEPHLILIMRLQTNIFSKHQIDSTFDFLKKDITTSHAWHTFSSPLINSADVPYIVRSACNCMKF